MNDAEHGFVPPFLAIAEREPDREFARFDGVPVTFGELHRLSGALAGGLRRHGVGRGDRVAVMLRNSPFAVAVLFALARAGAVWVPVNVQQRGDGLRHVLEHSDPRLVLAEADLLPVIRECGAALDGVRVVQPGEDGADSVAALLDGAPGFGEPPPDPDEAFAISYTSGTTGVPKGVVVSHRMLRLAGEAVALVSDVRDGEVMFVWEPLYHIGGSQVMMLPLLRRVGLAMVKRFSAGDFWPAVRRAGATHIHYLGGILQILLKQPETAEDRAHGVRVAWGGGCPAETWRAFGARFGVEVRECYGMTEASSITTCNVGGPVGAVGRPVPWFSVALRDEAGQEVAPGERGEIVVRTSLPGAIFPGYFRNPEATARALRDGALHTGDLGSWDADGNLLFHGRMTDSVRCRGENVSAWEVEHVVAQHPAVEECAVIGVTAEIGEQDIKLFVKPRAGASVAPAELSAWLEPKLAPYQRPRYVAVVADFQRTPSLRIMKHRLSPRLDDAWDRLGS